MRRRVRNARRRVYGWFIGGMAWVLVQVPHRVQSFCYYWWLRPGLQLTVTRAARRNLAITFGDQLSEERTREIVSTLCRDMANLPAEWSRFYREGTAFLDQCIDDTEARQVMKDFEERWPGGWIAVTGHVGNWELGGQWMKHASSRHMAGIVAKRQPNPHLNRIVERHRGRHGMGTLYREDPPLHVLRLLRNGSCIGVAGDQDVETLPGVFIDFLGRSAYTPVGPARLAYSANVPILVGVLLRTGKDRFRLQLNPPIFPDRSQPKREEVLRLTREWSHQIEMIIRENPEQWMWFHDRWKTTPERLEAKKRRRIADLPNSARMIGQGEDLFGRPPVTSRARVRRRREHTA